MKAFSLWSSTAKSRSANSVINEECHTHQWAGPRCICSPKPQSPGLGTKGKKREEEFLACTYFSSGPGAALLTGPLAPPNILRKLDSSLLLAVPHLNQDPVFSSVQIDLSGTTPVVYWSHKLPCHREACPGAHQGKLKHCRKISYTFIASFSSSW